MNRRYILPALLLAFGLVLLASAAFLSMGRRGDAPMPSAIGGPFRLTAQDGRAVTQDDFKGAPTMIFFGYTHCPDVCPTTLFEMSELLKKLGPGTKVNGVFVTVDPERDTAPVMRDYLANFDPRISGMTGDPASVAAMLKAYRVYAKKVPGQGADYTMDHTAIIYLMDKQMHFINALNLAETDKAEQEIKAAL